MGFYSSHWIMGRSKGNETIKIRAKMRTQAFAEVFKTPEIWQDT
jgi:hypothetical protein